MKPTLFTPILCICSTTTPTISGGGWGMEIAQGTPPGFGTDGMGV